MTGHSLNVTTPLANHGGRSMRSAVLATDRVPMGLFDLAGYREIVEAVSEVLGLTQDEVQERLFYEAVQTGWNAARAAPEFGITSHVFDEQMQEFYGRCDSFVFELLVSHLARYCQEIDQRVTDSIETHFAAREEVHLLALGDGIGTDSLRFARAGYGVTYFDFEGFCSRLAEHRFKGQGLRDRICMLHQLAQIPEDAFDVVICREVLEHVPDPIAVIDDIFGYLKPGGITVITESFGRVESAFPTHLASNQQYHGQTELLFVEAGFRLVESYPDHRPMVFSKTAKTDLSRFETLDPPEKEYPVRGLLRRAGRRFLELIPL